ncbi:TPA: DUF2845 domain-containing protein [Pseudomonas aeruginosa]
MRCGSNLISEGELIVDVIRKCGQPAQRQVVGPAVDANGYLNSTHKCNAHPCMHFVRRLPAQALARA